MALHIINWLAAIFFAAAGLILFSGCAAKERVVYQDVYIPVRCEIIKPRRPGYNGNPVLAAGDIIEYAEKLELALSLCTGE